MNRNRSRFARRGGSRNINFNRRNSQNRRNQELSSNSTLIPYRHNPVVQPAPPSYSRTVQPIEPKYNDTTQVAQSISISGTFYSLTATTNGTTDITRIGDRITLHSLEFNWSAIVADSSNIVRAIVFQWIPDDASDAPTLSKLLAQASTPVNSPFNHDSAFKAKILYDHRVILTTYEICRGDKVLLMLDTPGRGINPQVQYSAGSSTGMRNLFLCLVSDSGPSPQPQVDFVARCNWFDC